MLLYAFYLSIILLSLLIAYQDIKDRLVSLWALLLYGATCITSVIVLRDFDTLWQNTISAIAYFLLCFGIIHLYYYLKTHSFVRIINEKVGLADILLVLFMGLTFNTVALVIFFFLAFTISMFLGLVFFRKDNNNNHIPLAGILVILYIGFLLLLKIVDINYLMDCSFVN